MICTALQSLIYCEDNVNIGAKWIIFIRTVINSSGEGGEGKGEEGMVGGGEEEGDGERKEEGEVDGKGRGGEQRFRGSGNGPYMESEVEGDREGKGKKMT